MFARIVSLLQLRQSTAFLLARADNRLLDDIGLSRADLQDMHLGLLPAPHAAEPAVVPSGRALPVTA